MWGHRIFGVVAACSIGLLVAGVPLPNALADGGMVADAPTLPLTAVGVDADIALYGLQGVQTLTFPVPEGLTPATLNALVELPLNVRTASIAVTQDNRTVSRIDLPVADRAPVSIPLAGAEIVDHAVTVLLRSQLVPPDGYCLYDANVPLRLSDATISYAGRESAPTVVADFLPPVLQRVSIFIPQSPSRAESDAAVRLTAAVIAHYGGQGTDVDVTALPGDAVTPPAPSQPLERQIVVREGAPAGVSLQGGPGIPVLQISGSGDELVNQSRLLGSDLVRVALASKAVAGPLRSSPQLPGDEVTIRELGQPGVNAVALNPQVSVGLDQTKLGRPVHHVRVHLKGSYTPLPTSIAGQVVASIGGRTIDRWPTDPSGVIDRWVDVPDDSLQRYTNLGVALNISGNTGPCGQFQPLTLTIDGATAVRSEPADPPTPAGFQSLPQALLPRLQVGIGDDAFADTVRAATVVEGMQRLSALPLDTEVVSERAAIEGKLPALVIAADGWRGPPELPVRPGGDGQLQIQPIGGGEPGDLTLDPALRFGSLQTVFDGTRTIVVATSNGAPAQLDSLLSWLDEQPGRWSRLGGTAALMAPGQAPVTVDAATPRADVGAEQATAVPWLWIGVGAGAVVIAVIALLVGRSRRRA